MRVMNNAFNFKVDDWRTKVWKKTLRLKKSSGPIVDCKTIKEIYQVSLTPCKLKVLSYWFILIVDTKVFTR